MRLPAPRSCRLRSTDPTNLTNPIIRKAVALERLIGSGHSLVHAATALECARGTSRTNVMTAATINPTSSHTPNDNAACVAISAQIPGMNSSRRGSGGSHQVSQPRVKIVNGHGNPNVGDLH